MVLGSCLMVWLVRCSAISSLLVYLDKFACSTIHPRHATKVETIPHYIAQSYAVPKLRPPRGLTTTVARALAPNIA